jgi:glyoxylase-like metal-dependent hydrolase (beta-lactamase superfamily II)
MPIPMTTSPLEYPFDAPPAPAEVREIAPGVQWIQMPLPFALNHINLWLLDDGPGVAIVDCGLGDKTTRDLWERVIAGFVRGRPITKVIVTHLHPDHAGNAGWFVQRTGAPLLMSQADYLMAHIWRENTAGYTDEASLEFFKQHGLDEEKRRELYAARGGRYKTMVPEFPLKYHRVMDGDEIAIGGHAWRAIDGYGHAPEHMMFFCAALGVLISGDMVLPRISTNVSVHATQPDSDPLKLFLDSIARCRELPADTLVLPSHGLPFRGMHARVAQLEDHHRDRLAELEAACATPKAASEVLTTLFRRKLDGHQIWFAMGETLAHMNYLVDAGRVKRLEDADGLTRFVRV